ncbi:phospholipase A2 group IVF [Homo sapiens]|uniref:Phospholipase A2 group IVF n=1 Tax=Homo sapiens TaxID=9606 RepID=H3BSG9_HUMAN|nr:phospholipase A2 group IVF [Homo sapiens]KAI4057312.1 phospholipase A2 group IVF [Homo sapiens]
MLWALWPRWLADKMLPLLGAVLLQKREKRGPLWRHWRRETYPYYDLQVKVLRATNIRGTDLLSKADCYVQLWLPTASPSPAQTRIVANCSDPEWNLFWRRARCLHLKSSPTGFWWLTPV